MTLFTEVILRVGFMPQCGGRFTKSQAPSICTRTRIFLNPQLFLFGFAFCPHVSGEFECDNFLNPLSRVDIFESAINLEPCGRENPGIFESVDVAKSGLVFIDKKNLLPHEKENHIKQTLFMFK